MMKIPSLGRFSSCLYSPFLRRYLFVALFVSRLSQRNAVAVCFSLKDVFVVRTDELTHGFSPASASSASWLSHSAVAVVATVAISNRTGARTNQANAEVTKGLKKSVRPTLARPLACRS